MNRTPPEPMLGRRFGHWTVLRRAPDRRFPSGRTARCWHCRCDCGRLRVLLGSALRRGESTRCMSCFSRAVNRERHGARWGGRLPVEIAAPLGVSAAAIQKRLERGWPLDRILTTPNVLPRRKA